MKILFFIVNIAAGNGKAKTIWNEVKQELGKQNIEYRSFLTKSPGHAEHLAKGIVKRHPWKVAGIVVVGGDGTMHEVINGLAGTSNINVGFISAGSGNDFARGYSVPQAPIEALKHIIDDKEPSHSLFDLGQYTISNPLKKVRYFVNNLGVGFDAEISSKANQSYLKKRLNKIGLGSLIYVIILIQSLFTYKRTDVTITIDGNIHRFQNVWFITVSNQAYYGGGMKIAPLAQPDDGILDVTIVHNVSRIKLLAVFMSVFFGLHTKFKGVNMKSGECIDISSRDSLLVHADGEIVGMSPVNVKIQNKAVSFFTTHSVGKSHGETIRSE
ncbi:diacylglycerol kinase family lipid kinase [Cytobacillus sp. IB215316]|uniref:diacylglycerol/lipid kinase family protein n=1 Tax=Cytobacillus sp. IB215316 TaxID=3097354 RepID=UPI002A1803CE|nr:diacylglycerol kinase family lipid kinase [Cytobacillus sp. IB215316]MDX8359238.1 diacylglycerol kinase family lipid kinase [Cytobacillus sp. IB215316]